MLPHRILFTTRGGNTGGPAGDDCYKKTPERSRSSLSKEKGKFEMKGVLRTRELRARLGFIRERLLIFGFRLCFDFGIRGGRSFSSTLSSPLERRETPLVERKRLVVTDPKKSVFLQELIQI